MSLVSGMIDGARAAVDGHVDALRTEVGDRVDAIRGEVDTRVAALGSKLLSMAIALGLCIVAASMLGLALTTSLITAGVPLLPALWGVTALAIGLGVGAIVRIRADAHKPAVAAT